MDEILNMKCIKYGSKSFNRKKFNPIKNKDWIKPSGGLWASPIKSNWGWKDWCKSQEFQLEKLSIFFKFTFKGKAFVINNLEDSAKLPWKPNPILPKKLILNSSFSFAYVIDFELLSKKYDGVFLTVQGEFETRFPRKYSLYGWDCETLLVLNPRSIFPEKENKKLLRSIDIDSPSAILI